MSNAAGLIQKNAKSDYEIQPLTVCPSRQSITVFNQQAHLEDTELNTYLTKVPDLSYCPLQDNHECGPGSKLGVSPGSALTWEI